MVTEKSASCYSQEQSSTKIIEKDSRIILGATVVGSPKVVTFKDETTFKAQHRRDEASGGVSGSVGQWGVCTDPQPFSQRQDAC